LLAPPLAGQHFNALHRSACKTCVDVAAANPLRLGISPSNELARLRAMLEEMREHRIDPGDGVRWIHRNDPLAA
jgi:plastocyanin